MNNDTYEKRNLSL